MNKLKKWLFTHICKQFTMVLISKTNDTHQPTVSFYSSRDIMKDSVTLWLTKSDKDDTYTIRNITPY